MEIKPGIGIDKLKFGMTLPQIEAIYDQPNRVQADSEESDKVYVEYFDHNLRLTIYKDYQDRLGYITTSNPLAFYNGKQIIGRPIEEVKNEVFGEIVAEWEIDAYDFWSVYGEYKYWISLNVEYGKVTGVELGVCIDKDEEYVWAV